MLEQLPQNPHETLLLILKTQLETGAQVAAMTADIDALKQVLRAIAEEHAQTLDSLFEAHRRKFSQELERIQQQIEQLRTSVPRAIQWSQWVQ
jgi:hypothetical protein